jgi:pimeloyl-ACP methyl ester carboxylesterase
MPTNMLPYEISGPESPIPIVLVPGGLSGWISWRPHADVLSKNYRVMRVQLLNMATAEKNQLPPPGYSLRMESEALKNTLDQIGFEKVHLVGWSHGGEVSLDLALNYPDRIRTLTLIEPAAYWVGRASGNIADEDRVINRLFNSFHNPPTEEDLVAFLKFNGLVQPGTDPKNMPRWPVWNSLKISLLSIHTVAEHTDNIEKLKTLLDKPVLLVKGKDSVGANSQIIDLLHKLLPASKLLVLPDAHASHIVAQDQFIDYLKRFIEGS